MTLTHADMTLKYTDTSHPLSSIAQGAIHTMICEYISEGAAGENPRDAFVPAEEKPFSCLVVSKRTGTGKLCFRSNIGEQTRLDWSLTAFGWGCLGGRG